MTRHNRWIALLAVTVFGAASCGPEGPSPTPPKGLAFVRCGDVEAPVSGSPGPTHKFCAQIELVDSMGNAQTLQILLVSDRESEPLDGRTVLVYHPGGPGLSAVELTGQDPPAVDLGRFVVMTWDGTTASATPGTCGPTSGAFGTNRDVQHLVDDAAAVGDECLFGFGGPSDVGAAAAAEELEAIRLALGVEELDILALSYGTAIAEAYLRAHRDPVRRAVLDGPIALEVPWQDRLQAVGAALARGADSLAQSCATERCTGLVESGGSLTYGVIRQAVLAAAPTVGGGQTEFTATVFDQAVQLSLRSQTYWPAWGRAVDAALSGDGTELWSIGEKEYFDLDRAVFYRSLCADINRPADAAAYGVPGHDLLRTYTTALAPCVAFPHNGATDADSGNAEVLIIASPHDVLAPSALLDSAPVLRALGTVCVTEVVGHTSYRDPGIEAAVMSFLEGGPSPSAEECASAGS